MKTTILDVSEYDNNDVWAKATLSFRPFIEFLKTKHAFNNAVRNGYITYVIEQFESTPSLMEGIPVEMAKDYADKLLLIYNTLCPIVEDEETQYWALCMPLRPLLFYSTNALYNIIGDVGEMPKHNPALKNEEETRLNQLRYAYKIILQKFYNISGFFSTSMVKSLVVEKTGQVKFYRLNIDTRFIDVVATRELPVINTDALKERVGYEHQDILPLLQRVLPLDMFRFEGFGISLIKDITHAYAIENIKNTLLNFNIADEEKCFTDISNSLKALVNDNEIQFGLLPVLMINGKLIFDKSIVANSMLVRITGDRGMAEEAYLALATKYLSDPKQIVYKTITKQDEARQDYFRLLKEQGVNGYALLPLFNAELLVGVLEVYSTADDKIDEMTLANLEPVYPLLSQLLTQGIHDFDEKIEQVIKEKFTALQPAVQWKFNEAAWHFLQNKQHNQKNKEIEDIEFENVYPLYGAIDIRNSTINRNASLRKDLIVQFEMLIQILQELKDNSSFGLIDEKIFIAGQWLEEVSTEANFNRHIELEQFLENNIVPFLQDFKAGNMQYSGIIDKYFKAVDPDSGAASEQRRALETSMMSVISAVNFYIENMQGDLQNSYPCYFEKFRTDGLEYDIYIGQSIAPDKPFSDIYLKNLRLLQLTSMAAIAKYTHSLTSTLAIPVETTQMIFVHSNPITIKFRNDEKRFDVEGAYNIRYHIVKKRIDKALIKNSTERLTQPDKLAIVYFTQQEADEYKGYLHYLQQKAVLVNDIEDIELEDMQGVSGLRALRVSVTM